MANSLCYAPTCALKPAAKPGIVAGNSAAGRILRINEVFGNSKNARFQSLEVKATEKGQSAKINSIVCADCEGNGTGVNSVDHFNGQFKAGGICWLCRGKREILCGNCNGAGFMGGFMSSLDD
ncbi:hypothetical protein CRG98_003891 [Punica granatum]|uniref:BSD2 cysteine rich domain-containing protein n=1 Tax=Punica granatum TaxID=22663 RepID=A0A2I0L4Y2_PUNGR|nr:hypothetical protein CRG98_003891 [Punica granatum]